MMGGYTAGPECSAIINCRRLLQFSIHRPCQALLFDLRYSGNCGRHAHGPNSFHTTVARNTHLIMLKTINQVAGPCTEMFYQESIVGFVVNSASGLSYTIGPRSAGGKYRTT